MKTAGLICIYIAAIFLLLAGLIRLGGVMAKADREGQAEKEQCIILKHQKQAGKFLDMECERYVRYKQDN